MPRHRISDKQEVNELLEALESENPDGLGDLRSGDRLRRRGRVEVSGTHDDHPERPTVPAMLEDVSRNGCRLTSPIPLQVGDVFRIAFDREELDLPLAFGRCTRCRLIREDSFDVGLEFFGPIELPEDKPDFDFSAGEQGCLPCSSSRPARFTQKMPRNFSLSTL